ncbi:MAG: hypothetical protein J7L19_03465 [Dehalococcoidia bacterium]|nr:hypothetical protein [Dehalococcoidia bacterium]
MTVRIKKTYRGVNPEMLHDEIRDLAQKGGILVSDAKLQTYSLPSGSTQSRATLLFKTQEKQKQCGSAHIVGSPTGETKIMIDLDETLLAHGEITSLQENINFVLGSYELRW